MVDLDFETRFASQLRDYARGGIPPIDSLAVADATIATGRTSIGRRWFGLDGRALRPILVGLLLLALAGSALLVGSFLLKPPPILRSGYDAIFLRAVSDAPGADVDMVAVRPDGEERLVTRLTAAMLPAGSRGAPQRVGVPWWNAIRQASPSRRQIEDRRAIRPAAAGPVAHRAIGGERDVGGQQAGGEVLDPDRGRGLVALGGQGGHDRLARS